MEWMLMPYKKLYAAIAGRSSRQEYWMFVLLNAIIAVVFVVLMIAVFGGLAAMGNPEDMAGAMMGVGVIGIVVLIIPLYIWAILTAVAGFCVTIRRLHDLGYSGWFYLIYFVLALIPIINFLAMIGMIVVMCLPGTKGPNKWGEDPTDPSAGAGAFA